jgi:hypothetical protein
VTTLLLLVALVSCDGGGPVAQPAQAAPERDWATAPVRVLLVGNSYTSFNQLDRLVAGLLDAGAPGAPAHWVEAVAPGGFRFDQHATDLEAPAGRLKRLLVPRDPSWDWVVLQNQSQVPGFGPAHRQQVSSAEGLQVLQRGARAAGARTCLFQTWGYLHGDSMNPKIFADFDAMQDRLSAGYERYRQQLVEAEAEADVVVAPVGEAFRLVRAGVAEEGQDPTAEGSRFHALYAGDGKHPGLAGSYLAACVLVGQIRGEPVAGIDWQPAGLSVAQAVQLRAVADRALGR